MLDFIIVEDNSEVVQRIRSAILTGTIDYNYDINFHFFTKFDEELLSLINNQTINKVYILDIELPGNKSGIDIAYQIRQHDIYSNIIMITSHDGLFETVYRNIFNVSDFIDKIPGFETKLINDIKLIINKGFDTGFFLYSNRDIDLHISYKNILYIYRDTNERKIYIVTDTNRFSLPISLTDASKLLDKRFAQVHRACIVNKNRVNNYYWSKNYFLLDNGMEVDLLSKKYRGNVDYE